MCISGDWGVGRLCMYKVKRVGDNTEPCGTPPVKPLVIDVRPLSVTRACLPDR